MTFESPGNIRACLFLAVYLVTAAVAAIAVYRDAKRKTRLFLDLHPLWWGAITLIGSITGLATYWLVHYSSLRGEQTLSTEAV